jgi:hypothetical protein
MTAKRNYKGKDVDMLTTCSTIVENAIANQDYLVNKRLSWDDPFFANQKKRIENAFRNYLGIDSASEQRKATHVVTQIQTAALNSLAELKVQIQEDFKSDKQRRDEILKLLGYTDFLKQARTGDQEVLVQFLFRFNTNLTPELKTEITNKGIDSIILDRICSYANQLLAANITQETLKNTKKTITDEGVSELNTIYDDVISIAKIARSFYKGNQTKQDGFTYSKIIAKLNASPRTPTNE